MTKLATHRSQKGLSSFETFQRAEKASFRMLTVPMMFQGRFSGDVIQVGASLETTETALYEIRAVLWFVFPVGMLIVLALGYYLTGGSLAPVVAIQSAASKLGGSDLSTRLSLPKANDELRQLTETFNGMLDRLEDTFGRLRRFSSDVSHELRTPLSAIRGEAELALRRERNVGDYQSVLKTIERESLHMSKIVDDLLLLAKAESRSVAYAPETVSADEFLNGCVLTSRSFFQEHGVTLDVENHISQPLICAPGYLTLAVINLLINAAKHSPKGSNKESIVKLKAETIADYHVFMIIDYGEGIPADKVSQIFDPFYRVDSARNRELGGAGIGLSIAMALVKLHNGSINVKSKVGEGSSFQIKIPLKPNQ